MRHHRRSTLDPLNRGAWLGLTLCMLASTPASGQVLQDGHEQVFGELLGSNSPCPFLGASIESDHVDAHYGCGDLRIVHRSEVRDDAERRVEGTLAGSFFVEGPEQLREFVAARLLNQDGLWSSPIPQQHEVRWLDRFAPLFAGALFVFLLLGFKLPERRPFRDRWALWIAMGFLVVAALSGPFGSSHEHHTFLARIDCAAAADCFADRPGWYSPIYVLYAPLVRALPPTLPALCALSLALTLVALWSMFEWVLAVSRSPFTAGAAAVLVALHPAVPRLAVSLSFWPMALAMLFCALRLSLPAKDKSVRARVAALAAWCLAWCSSAAFTALIPLGIVVTFASAKNRKPLILVCAAGAAGLAAGYAAPFIGQASVESVTRAFGQQALFDPSIVPWGLALACITGIFAAAKDPKWRACILLLAPSFILGFPLSVGYPTVFLHAFPLLFIYVVFAALALSAPKSPQVRGLILTLVLLSYVGANESRTFADYQAPISRELHWLHRALPELPAHERLVLGPVLHDPIDGFDLEGDPIEVRFPRRLHQTHHQATVMRFDEWLRDGSPLEGTLVYVGLAEQLLQPQERSETDGPHRPEARELLPRFTWESVAATTIDTSCDPHVISCTMRGETQVRFLRPTARH